MQPKKKRAHGSPSLGLAPALAIQLFAEDLAAITDLATKERTSKGKVVRNLVKQALAWQAHV